MEMAMRQPAGAIPRIMQETGAILAPDLFVAEVVNTVWKYLRFGGFDLATCERLLAAALSLVDTFVPAIELYGEAFLLARSTRQPA
jgi:hypothetical protein